MSIIDYNYAPDGRYGITDRAKFQVLKEVYPHKYVMGWGRILWGFYGGFYLNTKLTPIKL